MTLTTAPDITLRNVTLDYGDLLAVNDISFTLKGGGIYGLLGRNGSGKTTLLSLISGFRKATAGEVLVDGQPVWENPTVTHNICLIREGGDTVDGGENIRTAFNFAAAMRPTWDDEYALRLTERFQLNLKKKVGQLSRGQRAALACTLGLATRAPLTMFDEAYLGLDAPSRYAFYDELLRDYMEAPRTIILSTHLIEEVSNLFGQVVIIDTGRLLLHEDAEALRTRGATITGPAPAVERITAGLTTLNRRSLGATSSVTVLGPLPAESRRLAREAGIEIEPLPLQDLFVHLTTGPNRNSAANIGDQQ